MPTDSMYGQFNFMKRAFAQCLLDAVLSNLLACLSFPEYLERSTVAQALAEYHPEEMWPVRNRLMYITSCAV
jgi:hypothetical protein